MSTNYFPVAGLTPQYFKSPGVPAANFYLKFYEADTSTVLPVAYNSGALDNFGNALTVDKVKLDSLGMTINASGGHVIPHTNKAYRHLLYANATDADNNDFNKAIFNVPRTVPAPLDVLPAPDVPTSSQINYTSSPTSATVALRSAINWIGVSVKAYGAIGDGVADDTAAITAALAANRHVYFSEGTYLTTGITVSRDKTVCVFAGGVVLKAAAANTVLFRNTASYCRHQGQFSTDSNSQTGVYGIVCGPASLTDTTTVSDQRHNTLPGIELDSGIEEGVVFQPGPDVAGTDSVNTDNYMPFVISASARRAVWLKSAANAGATITSRAIINSVSSTTGSATNTLVQIDAGTLCHFGGVQGQDINTGSTPNSTPTAVKIADTCPVTNLSNDNNRFFGGSIVNSSRHFDNANATTKIYGMVFDLASSITGGLVSI